MRELVDMLAFRPLAASATKVLSATTSSGRIEVQTAAQSPRFPDRRKVICRNLGPGVAFIEMGDATVEATVPAPAGSMPLLVNEVCVLTLDRNTDIAAICAAGDDDTAVLYFTVGDGA